MDNKDEAHALSGDDFIPGTPEHDAEMKRRAEMDNNVIRSELTPAERLKMIAEMDEAVKDISFDIQQIGDTISIDGQAHLPVEKTKTGRFPAGRNEANIPKIEEAPTPTNLEELVELYGEGTVFYAAVKDMQIRHNKLKMKRGRPPTVAEVMRDVYAAWGITVPEPNSKGRG